MKFEVPTRSTRSLSNFWNPTNPQISDLPPCRTSPFSLLQTTPLQSELTSSELLPPCQPASNPAVTASSWSTQSSVHHPKQSTATVRHAPLLKGRSWNHEHTHTHILNLLYYYRGTDLCCRTQFTFSFPHILCVAVVLFHLTFSLQKKLPSPRPPSPPSCAVSVRPQMWNKVFPVTVLCVPG